MHALEETDCVSHGKRGREKNLASDSPRLVAPAVVLVDIGSAVRLEKGFPRRSRIPLTSSLLNRTQYDLFRASSGRGGSPFTFCVTWNPFI